MWFFELIGEMVSELAIHLVGSRISGHRRGWLILLFLVIGGGVAMWLF